MIHAADSVYGPLTETLLFLGLTCVNFSYKCVNYFIKFWYQIACTKYYYGQNKVKKTGIF